MCTVFITPISTDQYDELLQLWESSVRATHHFLTESDIVEIRACLKEAYFPMVSLYGIQDIKGNIQAFLGYNEQKVEMLFVHPDFMGRGLGKRLMQYAISDLGADSVDVNEQNEQATLFYNHLGFKIIGRDETDSSGKPYPILHLKR